MNGTIIFQSIIETVHKLIYSIENAFTKIRRLTFLNVFFYLLHLSKKSMAIKIANFSSIGFPNVSKQALSKV